MKNWSKKISNRLAKLPSISDAHDAFLFFRILVFAAIIPFLLRFKLRTVTKLIQPRRISRIHEYADVEKIVAYVDAAPRVAAPFVRRGCLTRGLTLYRFLRKAGLEISLCFGIGQTEEEFSGHCWLMKDGEPFLEPRAPEPTFTKIYSLP